MDLDERRDLVLRIVEDVRRERDALERFEEVLLAIARSRRYPTIERIAVMGDEVVRARQRRQHLVEEVLQAVTAPRPPWWHRLGEWLIGR